MSYFIDNYNEIHYPIDTETQPGLRNCQLGAIHSLAAHFTNHTESAIVNMPTGSGKTEVLLMSPFVLQAHRTLIVVPSVVLRDQIANKIIEEDDNGTFVRAFPSLIDLNVFNHEINEPRLTKIENRITNCTNWNELEAFDIVIGHPLSLSPYLRDIPEPQSNLFDLILVDEGHHSAANIWDKLIKSFPSAKKILFTATPFRTDKKALTGKIIYTYNLSQAYKDGIFGKIELVTIETTSNGNNSLRGYNKLKKYDEILALNIQEIFNQDRNDFTHQVIVRTDTIEKAEELLKLYSNKTNLTLKLLITGTNIKEVISQLDNQQIQGIICVDMLSEGFDQPRLKIAALHDPLQSFCINLQFFGRFARTVPGNQSIGKAKLVTIEERLQKDDIKQLFTKDKSWQDFLNIIDDNIKNEVITREVLTEYNDLQEVKNEYKDIDFYNLKPKNHMKIYRLSKHVNLNQTLQDFQKHKIELQRYLSSLNALVIITNKKGKPSWLKVNSIQNNEHNLIVVHTPTMTSENLDDQGCFICINSTLKEDGVYTDILKKLTKPNNEETGEKIYYSQVEVEKFYKIFYAYDELKFFNVGMKNTIQSSFSESYRILTGPQADKAINQSDGILYSRGHCYGKVIKDNIYDLLGVSPISSIIWSGKGSGLANYIEWSNQLINKINKEIENQNETSGIFKLGAVQTVSKFESKAYAVDWDMKIYTDANIELEYQNGEDTIKKPILDFETLMIDYAHSETEISFTIRNNDLDINLKYLINDYNYNFICENSDQDYPIIIDGRERGNLTTFLVSHPPIFYFLDKSTVQGNSKTVLNLNVDFNITDLVKEIHFDDNVDIETEDNIRADTQARLQKDGKICILEFFKKRLEEKNLDIIFLDQGKNEIADFVTVKNYATYISIYFYHCKATSNANQAVRVTDFQEVCQQATKSGKWTDKDVLLSHIKKRTNSEFIKGTIEGLQQILQKDKKCDFKIVIVQPTSVR